MSRILALPPITFRSLEEHREVGDLSPGLKLEGLGSQRRTDGARRKESTSVISEWDEISRGRWRGE